MVDNWSAGKRPRLLVGGNEVQKTALSRDLNSKTSVAIS